LTSPRRLSCKRIEEHKQERVNTQSEITDMYEAKNNMDSSSDHKRTNHHSGEEQEWGPWINVKGLVVTVTTNQS